MVEPAELVAEAFVKRFSTPPLAIYRAPGRVNLIGEHTDYNLGFVLPIAIDLACCTAASPADDGMLRVFSQNVDELREWPVAGIEKLAPAGHWTDYVIGVAQQLLRLGYEIPPLNVAVYSTVPVGSGLSSSASLEVSSALALLNGRSLDKKEIALLCQRAEREFVGVPCGIMDQYVSVFGEQDAAIEIDCRSITHRTANLPAGASILVVNSMVKHELGESAYRTRVRECSEAVAAIKLRYPDVQSLRDVTPEMLERCREAMEPVVFRRAAHVTAENDRVSQFVHAAKSGDLREMGRLFFDSHRSMKDDYEITCEEIDFLVDAAATTEGVYGARMTGGGFGGCTVNLVAPDRIDDVESHLAAAYHLRFGIDPQRYRFIPANGAEQVSMV